MAEQVERDDVQALGRQRPGQRLRASGAASAARAAAPPRRRRRRTRCTRGGRGPCSRLDEELPDPLGHQHVDTAYARPPRPATVARACGVGTRRTRPHRRHSGRMTLSGQARWPSPWRCWSASTSPASAPSLFRPDGDPVATWWPAAGLAVGADRAGPAAVVAGAGAGARARGDRRGERHRRPRPRRSRCCSALANAAEALVAGGDPAPRRPRAARSWTRSRTSSGWSTAAAAGRPDDRRRGRRSSVAVTRRRGSVVGTWRSVFAVPRRADPRPRADRDDRLGQRRAGRRCAAGELAAAGAAPCSLVTLVVFAPDQTLPLDVPAAAAPGLGGAALRPRAVVAWELAGFSLADDRADAPRATARSASTTTRGAIQAAEARRRSCQGYLLVRGADVAAARDRGRAAPRPAAAGSAAASCSSAATSPSRWSACCCCAATGGRLEIVDLNDTAAQRPRRGPAAAARPRAGRGARRPRSRSDLIQRPDARRTARRLEGADRRCRAARAPGSTSRSSLLSGAPDPIVRGPAPGRHRRARRAPARSRPRRS